LVIKFFTWRFVCPRSSLYCVLCH